MPLPQVGLEAVIKMGGFEAAQNRVTHAFDTISFKANAVEKATGSMGHAFSGLTGVMGSVAGGLGNIATIAGGIVTANIFGRIAQGIGDLTSSGLAAVGAQQTLEAGLGALLTSNNLYEESVQKVTIAHTKELMSADELAQRNAELTSSIDVQRAAIQENKQRLIDLTAKWGDNGLATIKARVQLEQMQVRLKGTESDLANLSATETTYETQTKTTFNQVMDFKEAQRLAAEQSEKLLGFVDKLSIVSPFERDQVATVSKFAVQAGLGVEAVEKFTAGFLDLAAATGIQSANLDFAADQLLQVKKVGQIFEGDLRQLRRIGIDLNKIIGVEMGMSVDEFNAKAKESPEIFDELFAAVGTFANKNFPGAAKRMASTIDGIGSTFKDLFVVAQREFFTPIVEAVTPTAIAIIDRLSSFFLGGDMAKIGEQAGQFITDIIGKVAELTKLFDERGLAGLLARFGFTGSLKFFRELGGLLSDLTGRAPEIDGIGAIFKGLAGQVFPVLTDGVVFIRDFIATVNELFATFQAGGLFGSRSGSFGSEGLLAALGIPPDIVDTIQSTFDKVTELINAFMTGGIFGTTKETPGGTVETGGLLRALGLDDIPGQLQNLAGEIISAIPGALTSAISAIATFLTDNWPTISAALAEWTTKFWDWTKDAAAGVGAAMMGVAITLAAWAFSPEAQTATNELGRNIGRMITDAVKLAFEGGEGIGTSMASLMTGLATVLASLTGSLIILGGEIVAGILSGILESFGVDLEPATFSELGAILTGIGENIKTIAKTVGTKIITGILNGFNSTVETITNAFTVAQEGWMSILDTDDWLAVGESIIDGVLAGLEANASKVLEYLKGLLGADAINYVLNAIHGGSPAKDYMPIGQSIAEGIAAGIGQAASTITRATLDSLLGVNRGIASTLSAIGAARDDVEEFFDNAGLEGSKTSFALRILSGLFKANSKAILEATDRFAKFKDIASSAINWEKAGFSGTPGGILQAGIGQWIAAFDKRKAELLKAQQQMFIEAGKTALTIGNRLNDIVQGSVDVLDQRVETLQELVNSELAEVNFEGQIISALEAQDLLNTALAEQRDIQDDILQLKQNEQKLSFLEKQLGLVETLNEAGLNVKDILGGISLGLDASIPDMIEATNRLVQAMIEQVNEDLQLGSPSKVMMKKGMQTGQGFVQGLLAQIPDVMGAMGKAIGAPSLLSGPALGTGGSQRVINNNFSMSVNSGASPQSVIQQFEVMRAMVG